MGKLKQSIAWKLGGNTDWSTWMPHLIWEGSCDLMLSHSVWFVWQDLRNRSTGGDGDDLVKLQEKGMGGSWWELGTEGRVATHQNRVQFVDIWPMLNTGHVTYRLPCQPLFDSTHHHLSMSVLVSVYWLLMTGRSSANIHKIHRKWWWVAIWLCGNLFTFVFALALLAEVLLQHCIRFPGCFHPYLHCILQAFPFPDVAIFPNAW